MPETGDRPQSQLHEIESHSLVSSHVDFISYSNTPEQKKREIEGQFETGLAMLSPERQEGVMRILEGITSDIQELPKLHPGVSYVRNNLICDRIIDLLGECGVVNSLTPGGIERFRERISEHPTVMEELNYIEGKIKKERKARHTSKTGKILTNMGDAIREEMRRLDLIPEDSGDEKEPSLDRNLTEISGLQTLSINLQISSRDGLIGFSRLNDLTSTFLQGLRTARQTEDFDPF